jgi:hypothetical protein
MVQGPSTGPSVDGPWVLELVVNYFAWAGEVSHLFAIEAHKVATWDLLWWLDYSLLWRWSRSMVELLLLLLWLELLLLRSTQLP